MLKRYFFLLLLTSLPLLGMKKADSGEDELDENLFDVQIELHKLTREDGQNLNNKIEKFQSYVSPDSDPLSSTAEMGNFEDKIYKAVNSIKSPAEVNAIKDSLQYCNRWAVGDLINKQKTNEWLSDLHEQILERLTERFGAVETFKDTALQFGTPGALTWLSKQKSLCQTLSILRLRDFFVQAQIAMNNGETQKAIALASILNNTPLANDIRNTLCKSVRNNIEFIYDYKSSLKEIENKILTRIHILWQLKYLGRGEQTWGALFMQSALKNNCPRIVGMLEMHGVINPTRPASSYTPKYATPTNATDWLKKTYGEK